MAKIGTYFVPDILLSEAVKIVNVIYKNNITSEEGLATRLGHKSTKSGTFIRKMVTLRKLGLVVSGIRGVELTSLGKKIAKPLTQEEGEKALEELVSHVPLFIDLKKKLSGKTPDEKGFIATLIDVTNVDRQKVDRESGRIQNIYNDALKYLTSTSEIEFDVGGKTMQNLIEEPSREDILEIKQGATYIRVPKDKTAIARVKKMLEIYEDELDKKK